MLKQSYQSIKDEFRSNDLVCNRVMQLFHLISNKSRFRILCLLTRGEFCVNEIVDIINTAKLSNVSQQLRILTLAGVIEKRREDRRILYRLADEKVRNIVEFFHQQFLEAA